MTRVKAQLIARIHKCWPNVVQDIVQDIPNVYEHLILIVELAVSQSACFQNAQTGDYRARIPVRFYGAGMTGRSRFILDNVLPPIEWIRRSSRNGQADYAH